MKGETDEADRWRVSAVQSTDWFPITKTKQVLTHLSMILMTSLTFDCEVSIQGHAYTFL